MSLPAHDEIDKTARDGKAFSNHTAWSIWSYNWCDQCRNDSPELVDAGKGCPLIAYALLEKKTPAAWMPNGKDGDVLQDYTCAFFRSDDDGPDPEPQPIPEPGPGQLTLVPREPFEQARMLTTYPQPAEVAR